MHRILAILILVVITCFVSVGNNSNTSTELSNDCILTNIETFEHYNGLNAMSVANILPDGGSNDAMIDIIR